MTKKVLVTGVSGFLGHHCAVELLKNGYHVKGSLRNLDKKDEVGLRKISSKKIIEEVLGVLKLKPKIRRIMSVSYTHLRAHET